MIETKNQFSVTREASKSARWGKTNFLSVYATLTIVMFVALASRVLGAPANPDRLSLAVSPSLSSMLEWVADDQGFFHHEGLQVDIREVASVKDALDEVLAGKLDAVACTSLPIVALGFARMDFRIIGTVADIANDNVVVARLDRGIRRVADFKGRTVGVSENLMPHFMLDLLLRKNGLASNDVLVTFAPQPQLVEALGKGQLDGAALLGRHIAAARQVLGTNAVLFADKALFEVKIYVVVRDNLAKQQPQAIDKFLRGCLRAEAYVAAQPAKSMAIASRRLKMDIKEIQMVWPDCHFTVQFHQAILNDLEGKVRWYMRRQITPAKPIPNYLDILHYEALERIDPQRVTIIR